MSNVQNIQKVMADLEAIIVDILLIVKGGSFNVMEIPKLLDLLKQLNSLYHDGQLALPELKSLSSDDMNALFPTLYQTIQGVLGTLGVKI